jgi:streptogramin lyase
LGQAQSNVEHQHVITAEKPCFNTVCEKFESFPLPDSYASVRQLAGRKGEVWGVESAADKLFIIKSE